MKYQELPVSPEILQAVEQMGFSEMTEIQEKAIPILLEGKELIAKAPTGTGKTCAFGIPLIEQLDLSADYPQALILAPTRELATQIADDLRQLAAFKPQIRIAVVYGGHSIKAEIAELQKKPQIIVATPGRLLDHAKRKNIRINKVLSVVLDEADEMLNMGFFKDVRYILDQLPKEKKLSMFSATISREVMDIGWLYQRNAEEIIVRPVEESRPQIQQYALECDGRRKLIALMHIISKMGYRRAMVFCNTKYMTSSLCGQLIKYGFAAECLHGDMDQRARNKIMAAYKAGQIHILVSTNVAARGIDVCDVEAVFNYELPEENEYYLHRIGRTGRAKREGVAYTFFAPEERTRLRDIARHTRSDIYLLTFDKEQNPVSSGEKL
ncbi:MAG TPA: DEAD/DEAH box helicase [Firmicutes bacterium]|nr:DEAD/DEAH box helicase [Bacillota bacterium]